MYLSRGVGGSQLLALGNHREDTAHDDGAAGIYLHAWRLEDLREVLCHAKTDAMMLALADGCEVA